MPPNRLPEFENVFLEMLEQRRLRAGIEPIYLGGVSGPGGGQGGPPGGFIGQITQIYVTYDTTEQITNIISDNPSIFDNLNHLRAMVRSAGHVHGLATWHVPAGTTTIELPDFWEYMDWVNVNGFMVSPMLAGLSEDGSQLVFDTALIGTSVVVAQGVIART